MRLDEGAPNEHGVPVYKMVCETCGREYEVTSTTAPDGPGWENCLAIDCKSYDIRRDLFHLLDPADMPEFDTPRMGGVN